MEHESGTLQEHDMTTVNSCTSMSGSEVIGEKMADSAYSRCSEVAFSLVKLRHYSCFTTCEFDRIEEFDKLSKMCDKLMKM